MTHRTPFLLTALLLLACTIFAETVTIKYVTDGDTVVTDTGVRIRLYCIDAPENTQFFGGRSKLYLKTLIEGKTVNLERKDVDRYGRVVGLITSGTLNVNENMVRSGYAWNYAKYCTQAPWKQRFASAQQSAKQGLQGLWITPNPVAPWDFRNGVREHTNATETASTPSTEERVDVAPAEKGESHVEKVGDKEVWNSSGSANGREIHTGPRGGKYYISPSGKKVYVKK